MIYDIIRARHNGKENLDFSLNRPEGTGDFLFIHFKTPVHFNLDGKFSLIEAGGCIILSPETPHAFRADICELVHDWIHFMPIDSGLFLSYNLPMNEFFYPRDTGFITAHIKNCEQELIYKDEFYRELAENELNSLFIKLKRQLNKTTVTSHGAKLKKLREKIYHKPAEFDGAETMASHIGLSRTRFSVVYKEYFGISPNRDLIVARISLATHLLTVGTLSVEHISEACGYQSVYHFIRQFRKETGLTPGEYRRRN